MEQDFHKVRRLSPHGFAEVNEMKMLPRAKGKGVSGFGMGNPNQPPALRIIDKLRKSALDLFNKKLQRYSNSYWIPGLRKFATAYSKGLLGDEIDPERQTIITFSTQEQFANLSPTIATSGDGILTPNPSYPIHQFACIIAAAILHTLVVLSGHGLLAT